MDKDYITLDELFEAFDGIFFNSDSDYSSGFSHNFGSRGKKMTFKERCLEKIAFRKQRLFELQQEKEQIVSANNRIDAVKRAVNFAHTGNFIFTGLLFLSGCPGWGILMLFFGGMYAVYSVIEGIKKELIGGQYKRDTSFYDNQIASEEHLIEQLKHNIEEAEKAEKQSKSQNSFRGKQSSGGGRNNYQSSAHWGRQKESAGNGYYQRQETSFDGENSPSLKTCYTILGCPITASDSEIKAAFRKLAMEYHPDRVRGAGLGEHIVHDAEEKFKVINNAYHKIMEARGKR